MQSSLNTRPIEIAACTDTHRCPCCLRCGALAYAFCRGIFISVAGLAPSTVAVLTALQLIAPAQYPILRHVLTHTAPAAHPLPGTVNVLYSPAASLSSVL